MARVDRKRTPDEELDERQARALLRGSGLSLSDAAQIALNKRGPELADVAVAEGVERFLRARLKALRPATWEFYRKYLDNLSTAYGREKVSGLDTGKVLAWLAMFPEGSQAHARRAVSAWLHFGAEQSPPWLASLPSLPRVVSRQRGKEIGFLTVDEAKAVLCGVPDGFRAACAIQLFAGLRPDEISGTGKTALQWDNVNAIERMIRVPAAVSKTREARLLEGLPENLWTWLTPATGAVCTFSSTQITRQAQLAAGFVRYQGKRLTRLKAWPSDALRHTFATYHVAAFGDAAKTALLLGHRNQVMLYRHYRGLATQAEGKRFFELTRD